jgi:hypothetical protein
MVLYLRLSIRSRNVLLARCCFGTQWQAREISTGMERHGFPIDLSSFGLETNNRLRF